MALQFEILWLDDDNLDNFEQTAEAHPLVKGNKLEGVAVYGDWLAAATALYNEYYLKANKPLRHVTTSEVIGGMDLDGLPARVSYKVTLATHINGGEHDDRPVLILVTEMP